MWPRMCSISDMMVERLSPIAQQLKLSKKTWVERVNVFLTQMMFDFKGNQRFGMVALNSRQLRKVDSHYHDIVELLVLARVIKQNPYKKYRVGEYCKEYYLIPNHKSYLDSIFAHTIKNISSKLPQIDIQIRKPVVTSYSESCITLN